MTFEISGVTSRRSTEVFDQSFNDETKIKQIELIDQTPYAPTEEKKYESATDSYPIEDFKESFAFVESSIEFI